MLLGNRSFPSGKSALAGFRSGPRRQRDHRVAGSADEPAATGRFLTIFPAFVLRFPAVRSELKVLPVALPIVSVPNGIVTLKNRTLSPVARLAIGIAREVRAAIKEANMTAGLSLLAHRVSS
jgi:hypothetical protein